MKAPRHIQAAITREFPEVTLEWQPMLQWWVLAAYAFWPDGKIVRNAWFPTAGLLRGIEPWAWTNRKPILFWGVIEDGIKHQLSLFAVLETLRRWRKGVSPEDTMRALNQLEDREAEAEQKKKLEQHSIARDRASETWDSLRRSVFGRGIRKTPWTTAKAIDSEYKKRVEEQYGENAVAADKELALRIKEGGGISRVTRGPRQVAS